MRTKSIGSNRGWCQHCRLDLQSLRLNYCCHCNPQPHLGGTPAATPAPAGREARSLTTIPFTTSASQDPPAEHHHPAVGPASASSTAPAPAAPRTRSARPTGRGGQHRHPTRSPVGQADQQAGQHDSMPARIYRAGRAHQLRPGPHTRNRHPSNDLAVPPSTARTVETAKQGSMFRAESYRLKEKRKAGLLTRSDRGDFRRAVARSWTRGVPQGERSRGGGVVGRTALA